MTDKVSIDKQFEFIAGEVSKHADGTEDGIKLFVPMYAAVWGGSIWLRLQSAKGVALPSSCQWVSNVLITLLTLFCVLMTLYNLWYWWGYRKALSRITSNTDHPAPPPRPSSAVAEIVLCTGMIVACIIFWISNPFA